MLNQQHNFYLSIASPTEIEQTARQLRMIREGFLTTGSLARYTPRSLILDSWQRCHSLHVNPGRRYAPLAAARETQLAHLRESNYLLIHAATPILKHLTDFLADSGYVIVLSDANGCLLEVVGDMTIRRRLARIDFVPGGNWSEAAAGTNAIGTALADGHVVQLMAAEHYCDGWQDLTCTAAPIHHPLTNKIVGILDVTGNYRLIRPFLTNSLATAALEIQQQMRFLLMNSLDEPRLPLLWKNVVGIPEKPSINTYELLQSGEQELLSGSKDIEIRPAVPYSLPRGANDADRLAEATGAVSASLDLDVALEKVAEQTAHLLQLESAAVFLFNEDADNLIFRYWSKDDQAWAKNFYKLGDFLDQAKAISLVRERGEPVFIDNVHESNLLPAELVSQLKVQAIALLPLVTARGVIGFISAPRRHPYRWELSDVRLALALVTPSATAIEYARLFNILQQHNSRTEVLNTMSQLFNTLPDPNQRLELILNRIMEIMGLDAGLILLIDQDTGGLKVVAHSGLSTNATLDLTEPPLQQFHKLACMVTALGEPLRLDGKNPTIQDLYAPLCAVGFCDMMAVPLMVSNTIFGVWLVGSRTMRTEEDLTLFSTIGQQLGLTLKNAYLLRSTSEMEALREADRLKSGFIATVSHDLRSPLTAIRASVESLLDRKVIQSTNEQEHLLHNIADQAGRLGRLVDQLLDLSRIEAGALPLDRDWTELPVLIADTVTKFEALNNGFKIECDLSAHLPLHYVDPDRLVQVMWNLLENASKYASPSDPIRLETFWTGAEVLIRIADRGPGIPTGEREKVFQHFYRLDRDRRSHTQGSGLGLAICRGIVQAHGGRIWVEDRPGGGSVFCIALPLPPPDPIVLEGLEENDLYPLNIKEK